jgi:putative redox protein
MTVEARPAGQRWQVTYEAGGHVGVADTHKNGVGGTAGLRPHELLESAVATCLAIAARMALAERGLADEGVAVRVEVIRQADATRFRWDLDLPPRLEDQREHLVARLESSPVRSTLSRHISFEVAR